VTSQSDIAAGSILFTESPLLCQQTLSNKQNVLVCGCCYRFIGSIDTQLQLLMRTVSRADIGSCKVDCNAGGYLSELIPCDHNCGEFYCSLACKEKSWNTVHNYSCTGAITDEEAETHPLIEFKTHCVITNEIFLMVMDVFSMIMNELSRTEAAAAAGTVDGAGSGALAGLDPNLSETYRVLQNYCRELWSDAATAPPGTSAKELKLMVRRLTNDSYRKIVRVYDLDETGLDKIFTKEYLSRTIGMFEQNNVGVRLENPALKYVEHLIASQKLAGGQEAELRHMLACMDAIALKVEAEAEEEENEMELCEVIGQAPEEEGKDAEMEVSDSSGAGAAAAEVSPVAAQGSIEEVIERIEALIEEYSAESMFPPLDGTSFYKRVCKINHSCEPNARVEYVVTDAGLVVNMLAVQDIRAGEELVQSYIDQNASKFVSNHASVDIIVFSLYPPLFCCRLQGQKEFSKGLWVSLPLRQVQAGECDIVVFFCL
jgi:hypothetical protein